MPTIELIKSFKTDLNKLITSYDSDKKFSNNVGDLKLIISRSYSYRSLSEQILLYINKITNRKRWYFFRVGHNEYTKNIKKIVDHYSQEFRINELQDQVTRLNKVIQELIFQNEEDKKQLKNSMQKVITDLLKENAQMVRKLNDLLQLPRMETKKNPVFIPNLVAIVDSINRK